MELLFLLPTGIIAYASFDFKMHFPREIGRKQAQSANLDGKIQGILNPVPVSFTPLNNVILIGIRKNNAVLEPANLILPANFSERINRFNNSPQKLLDTWKGKNKIQSN